MNAERCVQSATRAGHYLVAAGEWCVWTSLEGIHMLHLGTGLEKFRGTNHHEPYIGPCAEPCCVLVCEDKWRRSVIVLNVETLTVVRTFDLDLALREPRGMAASMTHFVTARDLHGVRVWDLAAGPLCVRTFRDVGVGYVRTLRLLPDSNLCVVLSHEGFRRDFLLSLVNLETGHETKTVRLPNGLGHGGTEYRDLVLCDGVSTDHGVLVCDWNAEDTSGIVCVRFETGLATPVVVSPLHPSGFYWPIAMATLDAFRFLVRDGRAGSRITLYSRVAEEETVEAPVVKPSSYHRLPMSKLLTDDVNVTAKVAGGPVHPDIEENLMDGYEVYVVTRTCSDYTELSLLCGVFTTPTRAVRAKSLYLQYAKAHDIHEDQCYMTVDLTMDVQVKNFPLWSVYCGEETPEIDETLEEVYLGIAIFDGMGQSRWELKAVAVDRATAETMLQLYYDGWEGWEFYVVRMPVNVLTKE